MEHMQVVRERSAAMTSARTAGTAVALTATLGLAAVSWVVAVREMSGMIWAWGPGLVRSRAPGVHGVRVQQRADLVQRADDLLIPAAPDAGRA